MMKQMNLSKKLFESLPSIHQIGLETSMRCSDFIFGYIDSLYVNAIK